MNEEIEAVLGAYPSLELADFDNDVSVIVGAFPLEDADGIFDAFDVEIRVPRQFPLVSPTVFETGDRVPREIDRHCYPNGSACITYWPAWRLASEDQSLVAVMKGPIRNWFLSQAYFEENDDWPFGEYDHGNMGKFQAYGEVLQVDGSNIKQVTNMAMALLRWPKGHHPCPCESGKKFRDCHRPLLAALHSRSDELALYSFAKSVLADVNNYLDLLKEQNAAGA